MVDTLKFILIWLGCGGLPLLVAFGYLIYAAFEDSKRR